MHTWSGAWSLPSVDPASIQVACYLQLGPFTDGLLPLPSRDHQTTDSQLTLASLPFPLDAQRVKRPRLVPERCVVVFICWRRWCPPACARTHPPSLTTPPFRASHLAGQLPYLEHGSQVISSPADILAYIAKLSPSAVALAPHLPAAAAALEQKTTAAEGASRKSAPSTPTRRPRGTDLDAGLSALERSQAVAWSAVIQTELADLAVCPSGASR